jgi:hypothetical protein
VGESGDLSFEETAGVFRGRKEFVKLGVGDVHLREETPHLLLGVFLLALFNVHYT